MGLTWTLIPLNPDQQLRVLIDGQPIHVYGGPTTSFRREKNSLSLFMANSSPAGPLLDGRVKLGLRLGGNFSKSVKIRLISIDRRGSRVFGLSQDYYHW